MKDFGILLILIAIIISILIILYFYRRNNSLSLLIAPYTKTFPDSTIITEIYKNGNVIKKINYLNGTTTNITITPKPGWKKIDLINIDIESNINFEYNTYIFKIDDYGAFTIISPP
jgi:hypothetical protein